jgi:hypothetical protein
MVRSAQPAIPRPSVFPSFQHSNIPALPPSAASASSRSVVRQDAQDERGDIALTQSEHPADPVHPVRANTDQSRERLPDFLASTAPTSLVALFFALLPPLLLAGCRRWEEDDGGALGRKPPEVVFRFALQPNSANKVWEAANLVRRELEQRSGGRIADRKFDFRQD